MMKSPIEALCQAVMVRAVQDYRSTLKCLKKHPESRAAAKERKQLERFFHSNCYSNLDGSELISRLKKECGYDR